MYTSEMKYADIMLMLLPINNCVNNLTIIKVAYCMTNVMNRLYTATPSVGLRLIKMNAAKTIHHQVCLLKFL